MLETKAAILVREHRREVERAARLREFVGKRGPATSIKPVCTCGPYKPNLSKVPPGIIASLQRAINAIERHDARPTLAASTLLVHSASHSAASHASPSRANVSANP